MPPARRAKTGKIKGERGGKKRGREAHPRSNQVILTQRDDLRKGGREEKEREVREKKTRQ